MGWDAWWTYIENIRPDHIPSVCSVPDVVIEDWFVPKKDFVFMKIRKLLCLTCNCRCSLGWRRLPSLDTATPCNRTKIICNLNTFSINLSIIEYVFIYGKRKKIYLQKRSWRILPSSSPSPPSGHDRKTPRKSNLNQLMKIFFESISSIWMIKNYFVIWTCVEVFKILWKTTSFVGNQSCLTKTTKPQFPPIQTLVRWWKTCLLEFKMMNYIVGWTRVEVATKDDKVRIGVVHPTNQLFHLVKENCWCVVSCFF